MKLLNKEKISNIICEIPFVNIIQTPKYKDNELVCRISIQLKKLKNPLEFDLKIRSQYPFRSHEMESIKFINNELVGYNHVMEDGTICIHTKHSYDLERKLHIDLNSLKNWILKYYIKNTDDSHYEHLIVPKQEINEQYYSHIFTETDYTFNKDQFGIVKQAFLNRGIHNDKPINTYYVQKFVDDKGTELTNCKWSQYYLNLKDDTLGIFIFLKKSPSIHNRFIYKKWNSFDTYFSTDFLNYLHYIQKRNTKDTGKLIPVYIGYNLPTSEIHWNVAMLEIGKFPIYGEKQKINGKLSWITKLNNETINWSLSYDSSYKYFFGRGLFTNKITEKKILIIGVGAIGSSIAKTLTQCGCKKIDISDFDIKEPENVCRSEYQFNLGIRDKVDELSLLLSQISPFIDVKVVNQIYFEIISKAMYREAQHKQQLIEFLDSYDIIFDCSTDNDLMFVLNSLELKCDIINLSISNHAKELVCAFYPNIYDFVIKQFSQIIDNDLEDMYNPTGCWSPTFKASYNDINILIHQALKQINNIYKNDLQKNNFVIETNFDNGFNTKLKEF